MPDVYLDGAALDLSYDPQTSVGELVSGVEKELRALKRFILSLAIDGRPIHDWRHSPVLGEPLADRKDCSFISATIESAAFEGICVMQEYVCRLKDSGLSGAKAYRTGSPEAGPIYSSVFDGLMEVIKTMDALKGFMNGRYAGAFLLDPSDYCGRMMLILEEMNDANASGNSIHMADLLEHELVPLLSSMEKKLLPVGSA